jgi:hypothetical protein
MRRRAVPFSPWKLYGPEGNAVINSWLPIQRNRLYHAEVTRKQLGQAVKRQRNGLLQKVTVPSRGDVCGHVHDVQDTQGPQHSLAEKKD